METVVSVSCTPSSASAWRCWSGGAPDEDVTHARVGELLEPARSCTLSNNTIPPKTIYRGCYWFLGCEVIIMTLLFAFPEISLLPNSMK